MKFTARVFGTVMAVVGMAVALAGCYSVPPGVARDASVQKRVEAAEMVGVWSAIFGEDPIAISGYHAINLRPDGTGEIIHSFMRKNGRYWVVGADLRWSGGADTGWWVEITGPTVVLTHSMHSNLMSQYFKPGERHALIPTEHGLVLEREWKNLHYYTREIAEPTWTVTRLAVEKNMALRSAAGRRRARGIRRGPGRGRSGRGRPARGGRVSRAGW